MAGTLRLRACHQWRASSEKSGVTLGAGHHAPAHAPSYAVGKGDGKARPRNPAPFPLLASIFIS